MRETTTTTTTTTERTPLLYRGGGGVGGGNNNSDGHQHHQQHHQQLHHGRDTSSNLPAPSTTPPSYFYQHHNHENENETEQQATKPSYYDDDDDDCNMKRDRRSMFGRTVSLFQRILPQQLLLFRRSGSSSQPSSRTGGDHHPHQNPHLQTKTTSLLNDENYYEDPTNDDESYECCSFGTSENNGIWLNYNDHVGTIMSSLVWVLFFYSGMTIVLLAENNGNNNQNQNQNYHHHHHHKFVAALYCTLCTLALACHAKTSFTDPGSVPSSALPPMLANQNNEEQRQEIYHAMCSICQTYKPPKAHHCRICNRCICSMDHHCPWMNNCIGIGNLKHFILFLAYTWIASVIAMLMFGINYFFCATDECEFNNNDNNDDNPVPLIQLVRVMTLLCIGTFVFTSSMIVSVGYGIMTGIGTIDRLKRKANNTWHDSIDQPTRLVDIFGIGSHWTWFVPVDPIFQNYDRVMGYSTLQRLLRKEQILLVEQQQQLDNNNNNNNKGNIIHGVNENEGSSSWKRRSVILGGGVGPPYEPVDI